MRETTYFNYLRVRLGKRLHKAIRLQRKFTITLLLISLSLFSPPGMVYTGKTDRNNCNMNLRIDNSIRSNPTFTELFISNNTLKKFSFWDKILSTYVNQQTLYNYAEIVEKGL